MRELAAMLVVYSGVAAGYAAGSRAVQARWPIAQRLQPALWALAAAALAAAFALWPPGDGAALAILGLAMTTAVSASLFVLVAPVWPRLAGATAAAAPVVAAILAAVA
jgi:hypothetical protein